MNLSPLSMAASPIPLHAVAAMLAIILGAIQLYLPKGTIGHKYLGYSWVTLMALVSISSFFIHETRLFWLFSPIHGLSIFTLITLWIAIDAARKRRIKRHQSMMKLMYVLALLLTGGFTLMPGRIMHQVIFGG